MGWSGIMEWNGVEWILVEDAFWSFFGQKNAISKCRTFGPDLLSRPARLICRKTPKTFFFFKKKKAPQADPSDYF